MLNDAAGGSPEARACFADRYQPLVRTYLAARWRHSPMIEELDDAVQDVFVECLRAGGVLERAEIDRPGGFRAFLYGLVRNIALRFEQQRARRRVPADIDPDALAASEESLSRVFDRAWATTLMREAATRQAELAALAGPEAQQRVELLRLRFQDDLPVREIARRWQADPAILHRDYAKARDEFRSALMEVLARYHPGAPTALERECSDLLALLR
ncbi:MAG: DNA-directed polymerase specialized sigma subunit, sigma24 [Planctomycetota bacterium]|nr:DNA-directed polymerase specialized sigma subunit, sigma24 [Planctomycetota bacterium]